MASTEQEKSLIAAYRSMTQDVISGKPSPFLQGDGVNPELTRLGELAKSGKLPPTLSPTLPSAFQRNLDLGHPPQVAASLAEKEARDETINQVQREMNGKTVQGAPDIAAAMFLNKHPDAAAFSAPVDPNAGTYKRALANAFGTSNTDIDRSVENVRTSISDEREIDEVMEANAPKAGLVSYDVDSESPEAPISLTEDEIVSRLFDDTIDAEAAKRSYAAWLKAQHVSPTATGPGAVLGYQYEQGADAFVENTIKQIAEFRKSATPGQDTLEAYLAPPSQFESSQSRGPLGPLLSEETGYAGTAAANMAFGYPVDSTDPESTFWDLDPIQQAEPKDIFTAIASKFAPPGLMLREGAEARIQREFPGAYGGWGLQNMFGAKSFNPDLNPDQEHMHDFYERGFKMPGVLNRDKMAIGWRALVEASQDMDTLKPDNVVYSQRLHVAKSDSFQKNAAIAMANAAPGTVCGDMFIKGIDIRWDDHERKRDLGEEKRGFAAVLAEDKKGPFAVGNR